MSALNIIHIWVPNPEATKPAPRPGNSRIQRQERIHPTAARDRLSARALSNHIRLTTLHAEGGLYTDYDVAFLTPDAIPDILRNPPHLIVARQGILNNCLLAAPAADPALAWLIDHTSPPWGQTEVHRLLPHCPHPWTAIDLAAHSIRHGPDPATAPPPIKSSTLITPRHRP